MSDRAASPRCKNCGHLILITNEGCKHKQSNHSFYCPCRKPEKNV